MCLDPFHEFKECPSGTLGQWSTNQTNMDCTDTVEMYSIRNVTDSYEIIRVASACEEFNMIQSSKRKSNRSRILSNVKPLDTYTEIFANCKEDRITIKKLKKHVKKNATKNSMKQACTLTREN